MFWAAKPVPWAPFPTREELVKGLCWTLLSSGSPRHKGYILTNCSSSNADSSTDKPTTQDSPLSPVVTPSNMTIANVLSTE